MNRLLIIIFLIMTLIGCAGTKSAYKPAKAYGDRIVPIVRKVYMCVLPPHDLQIHIAKSKAPNAWIDGNNIFYTEGIFKYDDETLMFITAHEMAHARLGHIGKARTVSLATTGAMLVVNTIVPGAGFLNYAVNPAVVNNYSKAQELEADRLASDDSALCLDIPVARQIEIMERLTADAPASGGFWDGHPAWQDRIENIKGMRK